MATKYGKSMSDLLDILEILKKENIDVRKICVYRKGTKEIVQLKDIEQFGIDINKVINKYNLDSEYPIGSKIHNLRRAYVGNGTSAFSEEDRKRAEDIGVLNRKTNLEECAEILEILKREGWDLRKIRIGEMKKGVFKKYLLKEIKQEGFDVLEIINKYNLNPNFPIGDTISDLRSEKKSGVANNVQNKINKLGSLSHKGEIEEAINIFEILKMEGVDVRKIAVNKDFIIDGKRKTRATTLDDIKQFGINMNYILTKYNLDGGYKIGLKLLYLREAYKGRRFSKTSEIEQRKIEELGILDKKNSIEELIELLELLNNEGVDVSKIKQVKVNVGRKREYYKLGEVRQAGVHMKEIIERYNLNASYPIGYKLYTLQRAYSGKNRLSISENDKRRAEELGVIDIKALQEENDKLIEKVVQAKKLKKDAEAIKQNICEKSK